MNILFYMTPKCDCAYLEEDDSLRQAIEKMEARRYTKIPLLSREGVYIGTVAEGDLLWSIKNKYDLDLKKAERISIMEIERGRDYLPVTINARMEDLVELSMKQNFVPVNDDNGSFIGIVRRQDIIRFLMTREPDEARNEAQ